MVHIPDDFGFTVESVQRGDRLMPVARFTCDCGATFDRALNSGRVVNPEMIAKAAQRAGWRVQARRGGKPLCSSCVDKRAIARKGESPGKVIAMPPPKINDPDQQEISMTAPAPAVALKPPMTELTSEQRLKIRNKLETHFDDGTGCYLDGWTDQKIAAELHIPWAHVYNVREAAYGPIRVDPEVTALRNELTACERKLADAEKGWQRARDDLTAVLGELKKRLATVETKHMGKAAA